MLRVLNLRRMLLTTLAMLPQTTVTPVLLLSSGVEAQILREATETSRYGWQQGTVRFLILHSPQFLKDSFQRQRAGALTYDEAEVFAARALAVLRDIALADTVLEVEDATGALIDALTIANRSTQTLVAETLSMVDSP